MLRSSHSIGLVWNQGIVIKNQNDQLVQCEIGFLILVYRLSSDDGGTRMYQVSQKLK